MIPGLFVAEHEFEVPLAPGSNETISVFAREVADPDGRDKPWLVYLQGGPGHESPRPTGSPRGPGWLNRALEDFRVLLLDQRGTGRSTPVTGLEPYEYLVHFRADNIVRDCEAIRTQLGSQPWSVLGQSFGGLCICTYLSIAPDGLKEAFITGGVSGIGVPIDHVYAATFERMLERNRRYYAKYPGDRDRMLRLDESLRDDVRLPNGDRLSIRRIKALGNLLGMSDGYERLHYILELPLHSPAFLAQVTDDLEIARNPIYALLHEGCWADGEVTNWSAQRMMPEEFAEDPTLFTGEHIFPWMFSEWGALAPARETAQALAQHEWPRLYDPAVLAGNEVPVAATIYTEDLYVERAFAEATATATPNFHAWVTSEYDHNGLRVDGERILGRLIDLARGRV